MNRLKDMETVERKTRSLTLKSNVADEDKNVESSGECNQIKNLNLLTKRFQKFIKMNYKVKNQQNKRYSKKFDSCFAKLICFGCGKHGHIKVGCPSLANKEKGLEKRSSRTGKTKRAYIALEDNNTSSSISSKEEIEANLCLMAGQKSKVSSVNSNTSFNSENYSTLFQALIETHEEDNRLALSINRLMGLNN